jgi:hypothetical protein
MRLTANGNILSGKSSILVSNIYEHLKTRVNEKVHQVSQHISTDRYFYCLSHTTGRGQVLGQRNGRDCCLSKRNGLPDSNYISLMIQSKIRNNVRSLLLLMLAALTGKRYILPALICFVTLSGVSQNLTIKRTVLSAGDLQPIKFASVAIRNSNNGTYTNLSGEFTISCIHTDSLVISAIGYKKGIYSGVTLPDTILLKEEIVHLPEITISSKGQKQHLISLGLYNKKRTGAYTGSIAAALYIANTERPNAQVSKAFFKLSKTTWIYSEKPKFYKLLVRLKLYTPNAFHNSPGEEILMHNITQEISEKQTDIVFDIDSLNIPFPPEGIFVALEFLGYYSNNQFKAFNSNDQNKYIQYKASFTDQYSTPASWIRLDYDNNWRPLETGSTVYNFNFGIEVK